LRIAAEQGSRGNETSRQTDPGHPGKGIPWRTGSHRSRTRPPRRPHLRTRLRTPGPHPLRPRRLHDVC